MGYSCSMTTVCVMMGVVALLLCAIFVTAVVFIRKAGTTEGLFLSRMQTRDEHMLAFQKKYDDLCRQVLNVERNIATLKNSVKDGKASSCYSSYLAQVVDLRRSWESVTIYLSLFSRVRHLAELDRDDIMARMIMTHLSETEELCSRIKGDRDMYPLQRRRLVNYMKGAMEGYVFPLLDGLHYQGGDEFSVAVERIRKDLF